MKNDFKIEAKGKIASFETEQGEVRLICSEKPS